LSEYGQHYTGSRKSSVGDSGPRELLTTAQDGAVALYFRLSGSRRFAQIAAPLLAGAAGVVATYVFMKRRRNS